MRILIDENKCIGAGQCVAVAADVFDQRDEDGIVVLVNQEPPAEHIGDVRAAAAVCPASAITVHD